MALAVDALDAGLRRGELLGRTGRGRGGRGDLGADDQRLARDVGRKAGTLARIAACLAWSTWSFVSAALPADVSSAVS
jgi:hypothetical protein